MKALRESVSNTSDHGVQLYVDLDGVLADLTGYVSKLLGITIKTKPDGNWENDEEIWQKVHKLDSEPQFDQLPMMGDANTLWDYIVEYEPIILTATGSPYDKNATKKINWVRKHLQGYRAVIPVQKSRYKALWAVDDSTVLIDDRIKSVGPWKEAGGLAIHHTSAAETIKAIEDLGLF